MSLTNKNISATYKDIITIDNANAGFDTNIDQVKSGNGNGSSLYLSTNNLKVQPTADSTTNSVIYDKDGNILFQVDSTNDAVKALGNHVNTQYAYFGASSADTIFAGMSANTHTAVPFNSNGLSGALITLGTGTNPDTSLSVSTTADDLVACIWASMHDITVTGCKVWVAQGGGNNTSHSASLMRYDIDADGDLSNGVEVAAATALNNDDNSQARPITLSLSGTAANLDVDFSYGQILIAFVEPVGAYNSYMAAKVILEYTEVET